MITQISLLETLLVCLVIAALSWIAFLAVAAHSHLEDQSSQDSVLVSECVAPGHDVPSFLLHPALSDLGNQSWNWKEVGEQLKLERVFFNRDPQVLFGFLYLIEFQNAHPYDLYTAFKGFKDYMTSFDPTAVAVSMRQTIGHHRLALMALRGPPNFIDRKVFEMRWWLMELEAKGKVYAFILSAMRAIQTSLHPFLLNIDFVKDMILYLILKETVSRMDDSCVDLSFDCLAASGTERDILTALLITFCASITLTSINSFLLKKKFFKTNVWLDLFFGLFSPVLTAIYHFRLTQMSFRLSRDKSELKVNRDILIRRTKTIENLLNHVQLTKEIQVGFEAIMQIFLLLGLVSFNFYMFKGPSGQTYSYFYGVTHLVLKGNFILFFASLFISFLGPCWFYVKRHESLNMSRKLVLLTRNVLFLLVRVFAITSAIFIPVIKSWDMFIQNEGIDASSALGNWRFHREFQINFSKGLDKVTGEVRTNMAIFGLFLFIHFTLVATYGIFWSVKFGKGSIKEQLIYLISTFSLPLPFISIMEVDRGEENAELCFLVVLHSLENFLIVLASRLVYTLSSYPLGIMVFDCVLFLMNVLAVLVSVFYVTKLDLYAGLPRDLPSSLPSYSLEVIFQFPAELTFQSTAQDILWNKDNDSPERIYSDDKEVTNKEVKKSTLK